jgi:hypothetical protein
MLWSAPFSRARFITNELCTGHLQVEAVLNGKFLNVWSVANRHDKRRCFGCVTTPKPADLQRTELTRHFKACVPFLRHDTLQRVVDIVLAMVTSRSVNHSDLCAHLPGASSIDAKRRRVERGCRDPQLTEPVFLAFLLALLPPGKLLLSMDRTTWERGNSPLNLLVLGVVLHGYTVPLVWTALDHDGNSGTVRRIGLVSRLLKGRRPGVHRRGVVSFPEA